MSQPWTRAAAHLGVAALSLSLLAPTPAGAGNSPYSRVRQISPYGAAVSSGPAGKQPADLVSSRTVFDIVVSIHAQNGKPSYPAGDDDATVDAGASDDEQNAYEDIIRSFADGVCEMTNGAHHLGEVRLFKRGKRAANADIVWKISEWPRANVSGFGRNGQHIIFGDTFPFATTYNALDAARREAAGYTLAHEWGHYTLGLFDEYEGTDKSASPSFPRKGDTPPPFPDIMNSHWNAAKAVANRFRYLNLSQKDNFSKTTAQGRTYGRSGWDVVQLPTDFDPKAARKAVGSKTRRIHYTTLNGKGPAPQGGNQTEPNYTIELPAGQADCRKDLKIIWMAEDVEMVLAMDTSVSMQFNPLAKAQAAAKALVDIVPANRTTMGLLHFNTNVTRDRPMTAITNPPGATATVRNDFKAAIDAYQAQGSTKLYDGAQDAIDMLEAFLAANLTKAIRMVFILSDGNDTSSNFSTKDSVIANAQGAAISLSTFAYGDQAPGAVLREMASKTGGVFRQSPTNAAQVLSAFIQALNKATDLQVLKQKSVFTGTGVGGPGKNATIPFEMDSTAGASTLLVTFDRGSASNVSLSVNTPSGTLATPFTCDALAIGTSGGGETICQLFLDTAAVAAAGQGAWTINAVNDTGQDVTFNVIAMSQPKDGDSYAVTVETGNSNELHYPDPIPITAAVSKGGRPITGVVVEAVRVTSTGTRESIAMNDLGINGDAVPRDGIYTALLNYDGGQFAPTIGTQTIEVTVSNPNNTAVFVDHGFSPVHGYPFLPAPASIGNDGSVFSPPPETPVGENFSRTGVTQITLLDPDFDNHGDNTGAATPLKDDNVPIKGRIDSAGDVDVFHIAAPDTSRDLTVRVFNLALGMKPKVTVLDSSATIDLATGTLNDSQSATGYVSLTIPKADVAGGVFIVVEHADATAAMGNYEISAGGAIESDTNTPPASLVSAILPASRSVQKNQTVTVFMTILNASDKPAYDIGAALKSAGLPITDFTYQPTSAATNALIGAPNTPVFLDGQQGQSYLVAFRPFNVIAPTDVEFDASSFNAAPIAAIPGVNTLKLRVSATPVIDLIALAATLNNDGYVDVPGATGTGVFSVASTNIGIDGQVSVHAKTGAAALPVTLSLCQTDSLGNCLAAPASQVDLSVNNGGTPTFGVFVTGNGNIADDPARNRIFLEFTDTSGTLVGSTSVAVRTVAAP